jgi:hypothetical protein
MNQKRIPVPAGAKTLLKHSLIRGNKRRAHLNYCFLDSARERNANNCEHRISNKYHYCHRL